MPEQYNGVFVDMDGCLLDTMEFWRRAALFALSHTPEIKLTNEQIIRDVIPHLGEIGKFGHPNPDTFLKMVLDHVSEQAEAILPHEGVAHGLQLLHSQGIKLAVITSSKRDWAEPLLRRNGLYDYFDCVITREDVDNRCKPDPLALVYALQQLDLKLEDVLMVGDSTVDRDAAHYLGMDSITFYPPANHDFYTWEDIQAINATYIALEFDHVVQIAGSRPQR